MKRHTMFKFINFLLALSILTIGVGMNAKQVRADKGSDYNIWVQHAADCGCGMPVNAQLFLSNTTHKFTVTLPAELKGRDVTWQLSGIEDAVTNATKHDETNASVMVDFGNQVINEFNKHPLCISATVDVSDLGGSAYGDFNVGFYDKFYFNDGVSENIFIKKGNSQTLSLVMTEYSKQNPTGKKVSITQGITWESTNDQTATVNGAGTVTAKKSGACNVRAEISTAYGIEDKYYYIMVPEKTLASSESFSVAPDSKGIYEIAAAVDGEYRIEVSTYNITFYDSEGKILEQNEPEYSGENRIYKYNFKAGKRYYLRIDNYSSTDTITGKMTAPVSDFKVTFDKNGGSKVSKFQITVTVGKNYGTLPTAGRKGYTFDGWFTQKTGGIKITAESKVSLTANQNLYAHWKKVTKPSKAKISSMKNAKGKKLTVKIKKINSVKGYQIVYATSSKFKGSKKVTISSTSKTISKLKKGKTYYVKVRAYKVDSLGNKIYGAYSTVKKQKVKK